MPRTKQRTNALRERGLASALAVLTEEGVAGLTTRTVARRADASVPALYEVFGDKGGLIREVFFEGFRLLGDDLAQVPESEDPLVTLRHLCETFRAFVLAHPVLAQVMFSRPFVDFEPSPEDNKAGLKVSGVFVTHARAAVDAGVLVGDPADIAHLFFAFTEGMAAAESAQRLGGSKRSVDGRWRLGLDALINGLSPTAAPQTSTRRRVTSPGSGARGTGGRRPATRPRS